MFSKPQTRAYISQQIVKSKLLSDQLNLMIYIQQDIIEIKQALSALLKKSINCPNFFEQKDVGQNDNECLKEFIKIRKLVNNMKVTVEQSNEAFSLEVSLRQDLKALEQIFFKNVMCAYQSKIKQLKHCLFVIEEHIQQLQQQGYSPYIEQLRPNMVLLTKNKYLKSWNRRAQEQKKLSLLSQQKIQKDIQKHICQEIAHENSNANSQKFIIEIISKYIHLLEKIKKIKINKKRFEVKSKLENLSATNKKIKEALQYHKKIMNFERNQCMVRNMNIEITKEQCIDYLQEMNQDLIKRFQNRNIFLIVAIDAERKRSKSMTCLYQDRSRNKQTDWMGSSIVNDCKQITTTEERQAFRDIGNKLTDSFLDQCSYLISDRFIEDDQQTQQIAV